MRTNKRRGAYYNHIPRKPINPKIMREAISEMSGEAQEGIDDMLKLIDKSAKRAGMRGIGELSAIELLCALVRSGAIS